MRIENDMGWKGASLTPSIPHGHLYPLEEYVRPDDDPRIFLRRQYDRRHERLEGVEMIDPRKHPEIFGKDITNRGIMPLIPKCFLQDKSEKK